MQTEPGTNTNISFNDFRDSVLRDYRIAHESRQASLIGRKEVLTGKAKFGIFGDGKEVAQIAMSKVFRNGDFRSGYYRDQTFMMASGLLSLQEFFAQLYAHPNVEAEPATAGRAMNGHYATRSLNPDGSWKNLMEQKNSSSDISPTAGQMPRLLGLAAASKFYRNNPELKEKRFENFSLNGNEVAFGTIGDASTSEGLFFEAINAAGVMQVPMAISVWDDGYGISVPAKYQTTKQNISEVLSGFAKTENKEGYYIFRGKGWDYAGLCEMYEKGIKLCREQHVPVIFHIQEMTQPQGHSTSGSHERYKSRERLEWEEEFDCIKKMREWILSNAVATAAELEEIETHARQHAMETRRAAWDAFVNEIQSEVKDAVIQLGNVAGESSNGVFIHKIIEDLKNESDERKSIAVAVNKTLRVVRNETSPAKNALLSWYHKWKDTCFDRYNSYQYSQSEWSALKIAEVRPLYADDASSVNAYEILVANNDALLGKYPEMISFGEDVGQIGGVNQTYSGLQQKYGINRVFDTGIREATIIGQGIGMALRGLRPVAEIQYLDYLAYAIQVLTDDLACLQYRTKGGQKAPLIVSTRGHRLEGIWHSGSPMQFMLGALRGMLILVPRNMTQAAGFYNTLMACDDAAVVIEPLNGYRIKEKMPSNIGEFRLPVGISEVLSEGTDVTLVTYGSCIRIAQEAIAQLTQVGVSVELIDVQSLIPFDIHHMISKSLQKTNKIVFVDEDVPGGGTAYMMQKVIEEQKGFQYLEAAPVTVTAKENRPAYGSDGDYFSKSNAEDIFNAVYNLMHDVDPGSYPPIF